MPHPCSFLGTFFCVAAVVLLIFAHIGQISTSQKVPRVIRMVTVDVSGFGNALQTRGVPAAQLSGLYGNGQARTASGSGLRNYYEWGLWAYCASSESSNTADYCSSTSFGNQFRPANVLLDDAPQAVQTTVGQSLPNSTIVAGNYTGEFTKIAFYLLFIGAILAGAAMLLTITANRFGYVLAAAVAFLGFVACAAGSTIWTVIIAKVRDSVNGTGIGINVSYGNGLWICWGATGALLFAVVPLFIACCTGRHSKSNRDTVYGGSEYGGTSRYAGSTRGSKRGSQYEQSIRY